MEKRELPRTGPETGARIEALIARMEKQLATVGGR